LLCGSMTVRSQSLTGAAVLYCEGSEGEARVVHGVLASGEGGVPWLPASLGEGRTGCPAGFLFTAVSSVPFKARAVSTMMTSSQ